MSFGKLDPAELQCCGQQMRPGIHEHAFVCSECRWGVTRIEFLRSAHIPNVLKAVADKTLGRQF